MVELDNFKTELSSYEEPLKEVRDSLNLEQKRFRIEELEKNMEAPDFWDNAGEASQSMKEVKELKDIVDRADGLQGQYEDIMTLIEMAYEEEEEELVAEIGQELKDFVSEFEDLRITTMLKGEYDESNAILTLHAGAGGTESCDWASMLCRMYQRWSEKKGYTVEMLDFLDGDEAGLKSLTLQISGMNAYTASCVFLRLMQRENGRLLLYHAMLCRILSRIWILKLRMMIFELIRIVRAGLEDSTLIKRHLRSVSPISRPELSFSARMSAPST